jgi:hypothetical protein
MEAIARTEQRGKLSDAEKTAPKRRLKTAYRLFRALSASVKLAF